MPRAAATRAVGYRSIAESFAQQVEDQKAQVENLKAALLILQLIWMWLAAPVVERSERQGGGSQLSRPEGGVPSPLLANLYLHWFTPCFTARKGRREGPISSWCVSR
jgi:hypothetical protein